MVNVFICEDEDKQRLMIKKIAWGRVVIAAFLLLFLTACSGSNGSVQNPYMEIRPLPERDVELLEEEQMGGYWLNIGNGTEFEIDQDEGSFFRTDIELSQVNDALGIQLSNVTFDETEFMLRFFLNYETVDFRFAETDEYMSQSTFTLPAKHEADMLIHIDTNALSSDSDYRLTAVLIVEPNLHAMDVLNHFTPFVAFHQISNFNWIMDHDNDIELTYGEPFRTSRAEPFDGYGFFVYMEGVERYLDEPFQVGKGEQVTFSYSENFDIRMSEGMEDVEIDEFIISEYLIMVLLDGEPVAINGYPYLLMELDEPGYAMSTSGDFEIEMPEEVGRYDLITMIFPNPTGSLTHLANWPIETFRFTIEVTE